VFCFETTTFHDRSHRAKGKNSASMVGHYYLFACCSVAPFLMASGTTNQSEAAAAQDCDYLIRGKTRRTAFTQPSPLPVWRDRATRSQTAQGTAESPPQYFAVLPLRFRQPRHSQAVPDTRPTSFQRLSRIRGLRGTSLNQYTPSDGISREAIHKGVCGYQSLKLPPMRLGASPNATSFYSDSRNDL
jgi:hypothetical protein